MASAALEEATIRKIWFRLLPFLFALFVLAFIDRVNLAFAAFTMNRELAISSQQFGFAAGIFFWGYFLFQLPSNLILHRIGARTWIASIVITWGVIATLTGFVQSVQQLYVARFSLGLAEAGYFPGILLYLSYWFRQREKAQAIALIIMGIPLASVFGGPLSGFILDSTHWLGLSSWRWLLILEGLPAAALAFLAPLLLPSRPTEARFLTAADKEWIADQLAREERLRFAANGQPLSIARTLVSPRVWHLALIGFGHGFASYTFFFWLPQVMKSVLGAQSNTAVGVAVMVPNLLGAIAMILASQHSDKTLERRSHLIALGALAGIALLLLGAPRSELVTVALFSLLAVRSCSFLPIFFALPGELLSGFSAAAGIAVVTAVANLGGFVGPYTTGVLQQKTGSFYPGFICAGLSFLLSMSLAAMLPKRALPAPGESSAATDVQARPRALLERS